MWSEEKKDFKLHDFLELTYFAGVSPGIAVNPDAAF